MRRPAIILLVVGVVALALALWLSRGAATQAVMRSYLPAWLFFLAVPLGALPLVMGMELAGGGRSALAGALRRLLPALPLAALLVIPVLLDVHGLFGWSAHRPPGFAGAWLRPGPFTVRAVVFLVIWSLLGLVFMWPPAPPPRGGWRRGLAVFGLALHLVMGTLAAWDWAMSLDLALNSSEFGLLLMVAQCGVALAAALMLAAAIGDARAVAEGARPMLALAGVWLFLQFSQYLIVWSANLPAEIVWYQRRDTGLGLSATWFALACCLIALLALIPRRFARDASVVVSVAVMLLLLHLVEALWLVTPAFRGRFAISGPDVLLLVGIGGVVSGCALAFSRAIPPAPPLAPGDRLARA